MKNILLLISLLSGIFFSSPVFSQNKANADSLGLPGDNLNLYSVLNVFQESATLEEFEKKLNDKDQHVNNLDLNNDNKIDYLKVVDNVKGSAHAIAIRDIVNDKETQDVAVIEVEKDANDKTTVQIVGDETLYGKDYIVEPDDAATDSKETPNPAYGKDKSGTSGEKTTVVNNTTNNYYGNSDYAYAPSNWVIVHHIYAPVYVCYASPWYWGFYPSYWDPWEPWYFHAYYHHWYHPDGYWHWHRGYTYRAPIAHGYYGPRRTVSAVVSQHRERGEYRSTYSHPESGRRIENNTSGPGNAKPRNTATESRRSNNVPARNQNTAPRPSHQTQSRGSGSGTHSGGRSGGSGRSGGGSRSGGHAGGGRRGGR